MIDTKLVGDRIDPTRGRAAGFTPLPYQPHRPLSELLRILVRSANDSILVSKIWSLRGSRGGSGCDALIDTGASRSGIKADAGIPERLGVLPGRAATITTCDEVVDCPTYELQITIDEIAFEVKAFESPLPGRGFDAIIGRDILNRCMLTYDGPTNPFAISQPTST
jgi:hypothetical protein